MSQSELNLLSLLEDDTWFDAAAGLEETVDADMLAGPSWGPRLGEVLSNPQGHHHAQQLRGLVLQAWQRFVTDLALGVGTEVAAIKGQQLLLKRLQAPDPSVQSLLLELLETQLAQPGAAWELTDAAQSVLTRMFYQVLTPDDWQAIAMSARDCIYHHVLEQPLAMAASE